MNEEPGALKQLSESLRIIREENSLEVLSPGWQESSGILGRKIPFFLQGDNLTFYCDFCGFERELKKSVLATAAKIRNSLPLTKLAWHCHRLLFFRPGYNEFTSWPALKTALGNGGDIFYLIIALSMVPLVIKKHRQMNIPRKITMDTCRQVRCFCLNFELGRGRYGAFKKQLFWLRHYIDGKLFRIGRFEYMIQPFKAGIIVFREKGTGSIRVLAENNMRINEDGYIDAPGNEKKKTWVSTCLEDNYRISGNPVSPSGRVKPGLITLQKDRWEIVLQKGTPVL